MQIQEEKAQLHQFNISKISDFKFYPEISY